MFMNEIKMLIYVIILVKKLNKVLGNRWINIGMKLILINLENIIDMIINLFIEIIICFTSKYDYE